VRHTSPATSPPRRSPRPGCTAAAFATTAITRGDGGGVVLRFPAYELLQPTADSLKLLSLTAQRPGAKLDTNPQDYESATSRLFPKG
jgi:hypothetical protein